MKKSDLYFVLFAGALGVAVYLGYSEFEFIYKTIGIAVLSIVMVATFLQTKLGGRVIEYFKGAKGELRKVVWPKQNEVLQTALIVFVLVIVFALVLWLMDLLFYFLMSLIIK